YLLDYKSNLLGGQPQDYNQSALARIMTEHHYDLQYLLYTLALHRYLQNRLPDYQYDSHFGGVIYAFMRGMNGRDAKQGV
ncbi:MAG TPA: exodeoxyribonuclease V subunit beta, partial [Pasteurellaceae bacterium]|nr:exodeoxyribonuclease V subunit beta [Pasteurellaceae bacterium]